MENTIVFENVTIEKNSIVSKSILHPGVKVGQNVVLERVIVMENTDIPDGTRIQVEANEEPLVINQESLTNLLLTAKV